MSSRLALIVYLLATLALRAASDATVKLPPFIVEEKKLVKWRYVAVPGFEFLSSCPDATTRRFAEGQLRLHRQLTEILPPQLQLTFDEPRVFILTAPEMLRAADKLPVPRLGDGLISLPGAAGVATAKRRVSSRMEENFLPNLRLWDRDAMAFFAMARRDSFEGMALSTEYVSFLLKNRVPHLPQWFVVGFLSLYYDVVFENTELRLRPMQWISVAQMENLRQQRENTVALAPLREFFALQLPVGRRDSVERRWRAQAELFVRWGLGSGDRSSREVFWRFVERVGSGKVTEEMFEQSFHMDMDTAEQRIRAYLPTAGDAQLRFHPAPAPAENLVLRDATVAEIARIKGDWERLEIPYVRRASPELESAYATQARHTLQHAIDLGKADARVLAVMGLYECDSGNEAAALRVLTQAESLGPLRSRARYELARLRLQAALASPAGAEGKLSVDQTTAAMTPLFALRAARPPVPEVYLSIAEVWKHSEVVPTREHLAVLDEGVRLFLTQTSLTLGAAELNLRHGFREAAASLGALAQATANEPADRVRVLELQQALAASASPAARPP